MRKVFPCHYIFWHSYRRTWFVIQEEPCLSPTILSWNPHLLSGPIPEDMCVGGPSSTLGVTASASLDWFAINSWVQGLMLDVTKTVGTSGCSKFTLMQILLPPGLSQALPLLSRVWAPSIASKLTRDWPATPVHPTLTGKTLHPHLVSSHSCCRSEYLAIFRLLAQLMLPSKRLWALRLWLNILDLSLAQSKLKLCSANHRPGYWSNLPCDWPSTAWAYSEQEAENRPWSGQVMWQQCGLGRQGDDLGQPSSSRPLYLKPVTVLFWQIGEVALLLQQTGSPGPQPLGFESYIASALHQQSPSGLGCVTKYTSTVMQHRLIGCAPGYHAFRTGCTGLNLIPSSSRGWLGLSILILEGCSPIRFVQERLIGTTPCQATDVHIVVVQLPWSF